MTRSCARLDAYMDGALPTAERDAFEAHLLTCPHCQAGLEDNLQIAAAGAALGQAADRPRVTTFVRRRTWAVVAAIAASAAAAIAIWRVTLPGTPSLEARVAAALGPTRALRARLPYAPLDRHRPYSPARGATAVEQLPYALAAEVQQHGPPGALASVQIARNELGPAEELLARSGGDTESLAWSALELARRRPVKALPHVDAVLAKSPRQTIAAWNRALALEELDLPLAAAEMFTIVADAREPGWSEEARAAADLLAAREGKRATAWKETNKVCNELAAGKIGDLAVIERSSSVCRPGYYEAVRIARTATQRAALAGVAKAIDQGSGGPTTAQALLATVSAAPGRDAAVDAYLRLVQDTALSEAEKRQLVEAVRPHEDLYLAALRRAKLPDLDASALALRSRDPYFVELGHELRARALLAQGDPLSAEAELLPHVRACVNSRVELRCAYLHFALADVYLVLHQPEKAYAVLTAGLQRARQLGTYWDERQYFDYLAEVERIRLDHAAMRAYLREATLRSGDECAQARFALEALAEAAIDALAFVQARRDVTTAPMCDEPANTSRLRILAELASHGGTPAELAAARAGFAAARTPDLAAADRAYLDALEGRLLAPTDRAAATRLLAAAITTTKEAPRSDVPAQKARADAYASLIVLAAQAGDGAAMLALFAEATGVTDRATCSVGVLVDADRVAVVAQTPAGTLHDFDPDGRRTVAIDATTLVPLAIREALAGCARVDVLALPPVFGLPGLLPSDLAWSYRGRPSRIITAPGAKPSVLVVADTRPPTELGLPPLVAPRLVPIPGASHVELRGDAATPKRTLDSFPAADAIEIHSHGYMDLGESDASLIALSKGADGKFTLDARAIAAQALPRSPVVVLAACHAGYSAPYRHESWGLPRAFLVAGARVVLASPGLIPDADAGFFRTVTAEILRGTDPAVALRDARLRNDAAWTRSVLLFD